MERDLECRCCQGYWQSMTKKVGEGFVMAETNLKCLMGDWMGGEVCARELDGTKYHVMLH